MEQNLARPARAHHFEGFLVFAETEAMRNDGLDVEAALDQHGHLVPGVIHFAAVNARLRVEGNYNPGVLYRYRGGASISKN